MDKEKKSIGFLTWVISRGAHRYMAKELPPLGVRRGMLHILKQLFKNDGVSQQTLSLSLFVDKANTARILQSMEESGLITRKADPDDGRSKLIFLTEKGLILKNPLQEKLDNLTNIITTGMTERERDELIRLLKISIDNLNGYLVENGDNTIECTQS